MKKSLFLLIICFITINCYSQISDVDKLILKNTLTEETIIKDRNVKYGLGKMHKLNPVNITFGGLMYIYQKYLSEQISAGCLYSPSCSAYSKELFANYGFFKALFSTGDRLMRCDRLSAGDILKISIDMHDHKKHESILYYKYEH